jgi:hypothetical protein
MGFDIRNPVVLTGKGKGKSEKVILRDAALGAVHWSSGVNHGAGKCTS